MNIAGSHISNAGNVPGIITFLICYLAHTGISGMTFSISISAVMAGTIRGECALCF
jgi:hypothetical protein